MPIDAIAAVLLISPDPARLARFYLDVVGLPFEGEQHDVTPYHYGCDIGGVHLAIHPAEGWPGRETADARSPVIAFRTDDVERLAQRLTEHAVRYSGPLDHGWASVVSFRDPDGNHIEVLKMSAPADGNAAAGVG